MLKSWLLTVCLCCCFGFVGAMQASAEEAEGRVGGVWNKIHPKLIDRLKDRYGEDFAAMLKKEPAASESVEVVIRVKAGTDVSDIMIRSAVRPYVDPLGMQAVVGTIKLGDLEQLVGIPEVQRVQPAESIIDPPKRPDPGIRKRFDQKPDASLERMDPVSGLLDEASPIAGDWYEVRDEVHRSRNAWANGYNGTDVRVMVNDSGIDFCHPDLYGTWAVHPDTGWPLMYDSYSMYLFWRDAVFGEGNIAAGAAHYADTSQTCTGSPCSYRPLGAASLHNYVLPATSESGVYHIGSHPDESLLGIGTAGERAAILVVDEGAAGVYDTVYADLNGNHDFTDDPKAQAATPTLCSNYGNTGALISGGLVYFIADGVNPVPVSDWLYEMGPPANGMLVAFTINDFTEVGGDHGQLCASAVAAQGWVNGGAPSYKPPFVQEGDGLVVGSGRGARLQSNGNQYMSPFIEDAFLFAKFGYDGWSGTGDDTQIVSNSFGYSDTDNDGWDFESRYLDWIQRVLPQNLSILFSTGNGGPGYGTAAPPAPPSGISVGASTLFDSCGVFDSLTGLDQILYNDIIPFSNRGPGARGNAGVDVTANGAWGAGDLAVNECWEGSCGNPLNVENAWDLWGGTSRSTPLAAGILALVYDAYRQKHGNWPDYEKARAILMSGAQNVHYDSLTQGAGVLDADTATQIAGFEGGVYTLPESWSAGDYRGVAHTGFAAIAYPGETYDQVFTVENTSNASRTVAIQSDRLVRFGSYSFDWTTSVLTAESAPNVYRRPDYLKRFGGELPQVPLGTDLMVIKLVQPYTEFDVNGDYNADNRFILAAYDWKDMNTNGTLWEDSNGNGAVNEGEIETGEYMRFGYAYNVGTTQELRVHKPLERQTDGLFLGLIHAWRDEAVPVTHLKVMVEYYRHDPWGWLTFDAPSIEVPLSGNATFQASIQIPPGTAPGLYEGTIRTYDGSHNATIPVTVNVAAEWTGELVSLTEPASDTPELLYNNGRLSGHFNWNWRAESGDWRFFFVDVPDDVAPGTYLLCKTTWGGITPHTDIDTIIMGPQIDGFDQLDPDYYGPYSLDVVGKSPNTHMGSGKWAFQTSSGGAEDWVSAPLTGGLHLVALHNVLYQQEWAAAVGQKSSEEGGDFFGMPFNATLGQLIVSKPEIDVPVYGRTGSITMTVQTGFNLSELDFEVYGLSCPQVVEGTVSEGESKFHVVPISHGGLLEVELEGALGTDLDLYLEDPHGNVVATSESSGSNETVRVKLPEDGDWVIEVYGWSVPEGPAPYTLTIHAVQGEALSVSYDPPGPYEPGQTVTVTITYDFGDYPCDSPEGVLFIGPPGGETSIEIPVLLRDRIPSPSMPVPAISMGGSAVLFALLAAGAFFFLRRRRTV